MITMLKILYKEATNIHYFSRFTGVGQLPENYYSFFATMSGSFFTKMRLKQSDEIISC